MLLPWSRGLSPRPKLTLSGGVNKRSEVPVIASLRDYRAMSFSLSKLPLWLEISLALRDALERLELSEASELVHFMSGGLEDAMSVLLEMGCSSDLAVQFVALWEQARAPAKRHIQQLANFTVYEASSRQVVREAERKRFRSTQKCC